MKLQSFQNLHFHTISNHIHNIIYLNFYIFSSQVLKLGTRLENLLTLLKDGLHLKFILLSYYSHNHLLYLILRFPFTKSFYILPLINFKKLSKIKNTKI